MSTKLIFIKNKNEKPVRIDKFISEALKISRHAVEVLIHSKKIYNLVSNEPFSQKSTKVLNKDIIRISITDDLIDFKVYKGHSVELNCKSEAISEKSTGSIPENIPEDKKLSKHRLNQETEACNYQKKVNEYDHTNTISILKHLEVNPDDILIDDDGIFYLEKLTKDNKEHIYEAEHLDILYEDEDIIVLNKHVNQVVSPGFGCVHKTLFSGVINKITNKGDVLECYCGECENAIYGSEDQTVVHRIDKDTTGAIVFAKNTCAFNILKKQFFYKRAVREYYAFVNGVPTQRKGTIDIPLKRGKLKEKKMVITKHDDPEGRKAITHYEVVGISPGMKYSILRCKLSTGRTHQIRVHMMAIKNCLIGEQKYIDRNMKTDFFKRQALHAYKLTLQHPRDRRKIEFEAPTPEDISSLVGKLNIKTNVI